MAPNSNERIDREGGSGTKTPALVLIAACFAALGCGVRARKRRRPAWIPATAGFLALFLGMASCQMFGLNSRTGAATAWQVIDDTYFHQGIGPGPVLTTRSDGTVREERRYDPYGQPIETYTNGALVPVDFRAEEQNSLGKLTDPATGWSYHGARWMMPQTGRWGAPDPTVKGPDPKYLAEPWSLNPYSFAGQSPGFRWDPDGQADMPWLGERLNNVSRAYINEYGHEPYNVPDLMDYEKTMEVSGAVKARDRSLDKMTMNDALARDIEWAEKEYMENATITFAANGVFVAARASVRAYSAIKFLVTLGIPRTMVVKMVLTGMDLERGVRVVPLAKGTRLIQYVRVGATKAGNWFAKPGAMMDRLGISGHRIVKAFEVTEDTEVLESNAKAIKDSFSSKGVTTRLPGGDTQYVLDPSRVREVPLQPGDDPLEGLPSGNSDK